jgi:hypothetical protein
MSKNNTSNTIAVATKTEAKTNTEAEVFATLDGLTCKAKAVIEEAITYSEKHAAITNTVRIPNSSLTLRFKQLLAYIEKTRKANKARFDNSGKDKAKVLAELKKTKELIKKLSENKNPEIQKALAELK